MAERNKQIYFWPAILISAIILIFAVIWAMSNHHSHPNHNIPVTEHPQEHHYQPAPDSRFPDSNNRGSEMPEQLPPTANKSTNEPNQPKRSLNDIIRAARGWLPIYQSWYGKTAPDFTLTDINGRQHKLSDYRGKRVLITFWATWCGPCIREIPHLIALRNTTGEDKLAMLAITNERAERVKRFVASQKINYTVFCEISAMPIPYSYIDSIPSSFFIDPDGKIKLATSGLLSLPEIKAILQAE